MLLKTECPEPQTVKRYAIGQFSDEEGDQLEKHFSECSSCADLLTAMESSSDSLVRHLPLVAGVSKEFTASRAWLEQLKASPQSLVKAQKITSRGNSDEQAIELGNLGSYELMGILGRGGMGVIYTARHKQLGRDVAIKVINPQLVSGADAHARFDREIALLGKLDHPGIVTAIDAGRVSGVAYLVMERVDGVDLSSLLNHVGPLSIPEACEIIRQAALALAVAHQRDAIHRDIKPSNVMIERNGNVKLLDFGLAFIHPIQDSDQSHLTTLGRLIGTLDYMAPEQAEGRTAGPATDIFGLGATLFFLLTGKPPRPSQQNATLLHRLQSVVNTPAPALQSLRADVSQELSELSGRMLSLAPEDRPRTANEVAELLSNFIDHDSISNRLINLIEEVPPLTLQINSSSPFPSLGELLDQEAGKSLQTNDDDHSQTQLPKGQTKRIFPPRFLFPLILAVAFLGAAWWGVVVILNTSDDTLRVESDQPNAKIEIKRDGDRITGVEIESEPIATTGEPVYQGKTRSGWQTRFEAETDPLSKIVAATALVQLHPSDDPNLVNSIVHIGGIMVNQGWGPGCDAYCDWFLNHMPGVTKHFGPTSWPRDAELAKQWNAFVDLAERRLGQTVGPTQLVSLLKDRIANGTGGEAAFAMHMIYASQNHLRDKPKVAEIMLTPDTELDRIRACWLSHLQYKYYSDASTVKQQAFVEYIESTVHQTITLPSENLHQSLSVGWLRAVQHYDIPIDRRLQADIALKQLLGAPSDALSNVFQTRWMNIGEYPYPDAWMKAARDATPNVWDQWMSVACKWLVDHPEPSSQSQDVLTTLDIQLRLRKQLDDWPVHELIEELGQRFARLNQNGENEFEMPHGLLALIVLAGGDFPAEARSAIQQKTDTTPEALQKALDTSTSDVDWSIQRNAFQSAEGIVKSDPIVTIKSLLKYPNTASDDGWSASRFRDQLVWLSGRGDGDDGPPPMEPLLLLAIMTELAGQSEELDNRIAAVFKERHPAHIFRRHIKDAVTYPFAINQVADKWLRKMRERSKSDALNEELDGLLPKSETASTADQPQDDHSNRPTRTEPAKLIVSRSLEEWQAQLKSEGTPKKRLDSARRAIDSFHFYANDENGEIASESIKVGAAILSVLWENVPNAIKDYYFEKVSDESITRGLDNAKVGEEWFEFLGKAQSKIIASCDHVTSTQLLATAIAQGTFEESAFALIIASRQAPSIMADDQTRPILIAALDIAVDSSQKSLLTSIVRAEIYGKTLPQGHQLRRQAIDDFNASGELLADMLSDLNRAHRGSYPNIYFTYQHLTESWLHIASQFEASPLVAAKLQIENGWFRWNGDENYFAKLFDPRTQFESRPYFASNLERKRKDVEWFVDGWLPAAADYLQRIPLVMSVDARERAIFNSVAAALPLVRDSQENRTAAENIGDYLTARLRRIYVSGEEGSFRPTEDPQILEDLEVSSNERHQTVLSQCRGRLPDFLLTDPPLDLRKQEAVSEYKRLMASETTDEFLRIADTTTDAMQQAPFKVLMIDAQLANAPIGLNREAALYSASRIATHVKPTLKTPPADPFLFIAAYERLIGEIDLADENLLFYLTQAEPTFLSRQLEDIFERPGFLKQQMRDMLVRLAQKAHNNSLRSAILAIDVTVANEFGKRSE